jgi:thioredoxin reductase (NADPH)
VITVAAEATGIELQENQKIVKTTEGKFIASVVIIAGSSKRQKLDVPGEEKYTGKGVSYCATCDGAFFKEQPVAITGGGNAAISEALHLTKFASKVTVIHRRQQLRASRILQERAFAEHKIEFLWNTIVDEIEGETLVTGLKLSNAVTGEKSTLKVAGIFIAIGSKPDTDYIRDILSLDAVGHIITNEKMETGVPGIFATGDIRSNSARQAITAAGDGATAAIYAERFLTEQYS